MQPWTCHFPHGRAAKAGSGQWAQENGLAGHAHPAARSEEEGREEGHCAVVRVEGPIVFANAQYVRDRITAIEVRGSLIKPCLTSSSLPCWHAKTAPILACKGMHACSCSGPFAG